MGSPKLALNGNILEKDNVVIEDKVKKICVQIRTAGASLSNNKSQPLRRRIEDILNSHRSFLAEQLGILHPSIMFNDIMSKTYSVVTKTAFMNSSLYVDGKAIMENSEIPIPPILSVDIFSKSLDFICDNNFEFNNKEEMFKRLLDLIYLPNRESTKTNPEFLSDLLIDGVSDDIFVTRSDKIANDCIHHLKEEWMDETGKYLLCEFVEGILVNINKTLNKNNYSHLKEQSLVADALRFLELLCNKLNTLTINAITIDIKQNDISEMKSSSFPVSPYLLLIIIDNIKHTVKNQITIKNSFDHCIFVLKRDFSKNAIKNGLVIQGLAIATHRLEDFNANEKFLTYSKMIWAELYSIFHDKVIYDQFIYQRGIDNANTKMLNISGHTLRNMLDSLHMQLNRFSTRQLSKPDSDAIEPLINLSKGMSSLFEALRLMSKVSPHIRQSISDKKEFTNFNERFFEKLKNLKYPAKRFSRNNKYHRIILLSSINITPSATCPFKIKGDIHSPFLNNSVWNNESQKLLDAIFWEMFLNTAKHGVANPTKNESSQNDFRDVGIYIYPITSTALDHKLNGFVIGNFIHNPMPKYSEDFERFNENDTISTSLLSSILSLNGLGNIYIRSYSYEKEFRYEILLLLEGVIYFDQN